MKFTEETVKVPVVMADLVSKNLPVLNEEEVASFQVTVVRDDKRKRQAEWLKDNWLLGLFLNNTFLLISAVILLTLLALGVIVRSSYSVGVAGILGVFLLILGPFMARDEFQKSVKVRPWQKLPFKNLEGEYKERSKTIAYELCPPDCPQDILLEVEWHEVSPVRFLLASSGEEPNRLSYYIDFWEVS